MNIEPITRVLVVDDDRLIRWTLESALKSKGYDVTTVDSAEKALAEVGAGGFDAAVVDVVLPGMSGLELIGRMRSVCSGIKTIIVTGQGSREVEQRALEQGAFAYVEKPFSVKELTELVEVALRSKGMDQGHGEKQ